MGKQKIILIGGGGHCKSVIDVIEQSNQFDIVGILDLKEKVGNLILGYPIIGTDEDIDLFKKDCQNFHISLGMIDPTDKRKLFFIELLKKGYQFPTIQSPLAYVSKHATIGSGTIIMHQAVVNAGAVIGNNCIINTRSIVEHDAVIEDNCHIAPGAIINGGATVGNNSFVGSGAVTKQGITIPPGSFIKANNIVK